MRAVQCAHVSLLVAITCLCAVAGTRAQPLDAAKKLIEWVEQLGGVVNVELKVNADGVRGIFATKAIKADENLVSVPASAILNAGGLNDSFAVPTLSVLRELKTNNSRLKPYVDIWPSPTEVVNSCNMDLKYLKMWKSPYWEKNMRDWDGHLRSLLSGQLNPDIEYTIEEVVGAEPVSIEDIKYACAISSTRYVSTHRRRRLLMVPLFDMANHARECPHHISGYEQGDWFHLIAGEDLEAGDEVCYSYGPLRDDYAVAHYGFLPALEDPPRLSLVDHRDFGELSSYSHEDPPEEEPFVGTEAEMEVELERLRGILHGLRATPDPLPPSPPGADYVYDLFKELERRRVAALEYEIRRVSAILNRNTEHGSVV